jgi:hypothetical protein
MPGLYILPDMRAMSIPGQVPRLHMREPVDEMAHIPDITDGVRVEGDVFKGLTLDKSQENFIRGLLSSAMSAENEVTLRQDLMSGMIDKKINPGVRRTVLQRAVDLFRQTRARPRLRMVMNKSERGVDEEVGAMLDEAGHAGVQLEDLVPCISRYGADAVIRALKKIDVELLPDRVISREHADRYVVKSDAETLPKQRSPRWGGGVEEDVRAEPVGARKVWRKRIVEKKPDGKWHVVGTVPGLEDPKRVEPVDTGTLSREALQRLVQELARRRFGTTNPVEDGVEKAKRGKSTPAPPSHRVRGSKVNKPGSSASSTSGADIELSDEVEAGLQNKVKEHNAKHDSASKRVTLGMLKSVWRRGAGAYSVSHRPGMTRQQWAMGRVNAFLDLVRTGKPGDKDYVTDNDLLPAGHPRKS